MTRQATDFNVLEQPTYDDVCWEKLYTMIRHTVVRYVYHANVSSWKGQEYDIIEDIVQETVTRVFIRLQETQSGNMLPIVSLHYL